MLDERYQMLALGKHRALHSSNPECFSKVIVDDDLFAAAITTRTLLRVDRTARSRLVPRCRHTPLRLCSVARRRKVIRRKDQTGKWLKLKGISILQFTSDPIAASNGLEHGTVF